MDYQVLTKEQAQASMKHSRSAAFKAAVRQRSKDVAASAPYDDWTPEANTAIRFRLASAVLRPAMDRKTRTAIPGTDDYALRWQICDSTSGDDGKQFQTIYRQFPPNPNFDPGSQGARRIRNLLEVALSAPGEEVAPADREDEWPELLSDLVSQDPPMIFAGKYCEKTNPKNQFVDRFVTVYEREDSDEDDAEPADPGEALESDTLGDEAPEYDPSEPAEPVAAEPATAPRATRKVGRPRKKRQ